MVLGSAVVLSANVSCLFMHMAVKHKLGRKKPINFTQMPKLVNYIDYIEKVYTIELKELTSSNGGASPTGKLIVFKLMISYSEDMEV